MKVAKVIETGIYSEDLEKAEKFYTTILGLDVVSKQLPRHVFLSAGKSMLLIFNPRETLKGGGGIPTHSASGPAHFAFEIEPQDYDLWKLRLTDNKIKIESEVVWDGRSKSIYFRDPDNHSVELMTKGFWPVED